MYGSFNMRSAAFDVEFDGKTFTFTNYGWGHGVGMSQVGANGFAKRGWTYKQILEHYYTGVEIVNFNA